MSKSWVIIEDHKTTYLRGIEVYLEYFSTQEEAELRAEEIRKTSEYPIRVHLIQPIRKSLDYHGIARKIRP